MKSWDYSSTAHGLLTRGPVDRNHSRPPIRGPVTVAAERGGLLIRWQCPSQVRILPGPLCACTPMAEGTRRERVQCSFESSQAHQISSVAEIVLDLSRAIVLRCYASGEAARLSIERDGFDSRTARHTRSVAQPGSALRSERRGRWFKSSHSDHFLRAMRNIARTLRTASALACGSVL